MHPLKVVEIKNPFGIFQPTTQIPQEWVGFIFFLKNMFWWDTLAYMERLYTTKMANRLCGKMGSFITMSPPLSLMSFIFP